MAGPVQAVMSPSDGSRLARVEEEILSMPGPEFEAFAEWFQMILLLRRAVTGTGYKCESAMPELREEAIASSPPASNAIKWSWQHQATWRSMAEEEEEELLREEEARAAAAAAAQEAAALKEAETCREPDPEKSPWPRPEAMEVGLPQVTPAGQPKPVDAKAERPWRIAKRRQAAAQGEEGEGGPGVAAPHSSPAKPASGEESSPRAARAVAEGQDAHSPKEPSEPAEAASGSDGARPVASQAEAAAGAPKVPEPAEAPVKAETPVKAEAAIEAEETGTPTNAATAMPQVALKEADWPAVCVKAKAKAKAMARAADGNCDDEAAALSAPRGDAEEGQGSKEEVPTSDAAGDGEAGTAPEGEEASQTSRGKAVEAPTVEEAPTAGAAPGAGALGAARGQEAEAFVALAASAETGEVTPSAPEEDRGERGASVAPVEEESPKRNRGWEVPRALPNPRGWEVPRASKEEALKKDGLNKGEVEESDKVAWARAGWIDKEAWHQQWQRKPCNKIPETSTSSATRSTASGTPAVSRSEDLRRKEVQPDLGPGCLYHSWDDGCAALLRLCGFWNDTTGSSYEVTYCPPGDRLNVSTLRPKTGKVMFTRGLIRLERMPQNVMRISWGKMASFVLISSGNFGEKVLWTCPEGDKRAFEWRRDKQAEAKRAKWS